MAKFIVRRIVWTIPVILLVILMTFGMMKAIKGNPFRHTEKNIPAAIQKNLNRAYHLDKPWYVQYAYYVKGVFTWNLGPSMLQRDRSVNDIVSQGFPISAELGGLAMLFAIIVGIPLGIVAALRQNSVFDYAAMTLSNIGFAIPAFLTSVLFLYFFALKWGSVTGFPTFGWGGFHAKILPSIALGLGPMTYFARLVRGSMLETLQQDYIRTAKAKGLRWQRVVGLHVLRNSLIPAVTAAGPLLGYLVTGSFIIERIFNIPGIGQYYVISVSSRDLSVTMGLTVLLSILIIVANLFVDIAYGVLDPRTRDQRA
jgi:ABC-type dipeptide/oligopeptide/nickel transport system permease component